jgi:hypothetical protein
VAGSDTPTPSPPLHPVYHQQILKLFSQISWLFNRPAKGVRLIVTRLELFPKRRVAISGIASALFIQQHSNIVTDFDIQVDKKSFDRLQLASCDCFMKAGCLMVG